MASRSFRIWETLGSLSRTLQNGHGWYISSHPWFLSNMVFATPEYSTHQTDCTDWCATVQGEVSTRVIAGKVPRFLLLDTCDLASENWAKACHGNTCFASCSRTVRWCWALMDGDVGKTIFSGLWRVKELSLLPRVFSMHFAEKLQDPLNRNLWQILGTTQ